MTQTITKNIVAVAFVTAIFSILLAMPQASEAKVSMSDMSITMKSKKVASSTDDVKRPSPAISCVQIAVQEREMAIIDSWTGFNTSITAALTARKDALVDAWQLTDAKEQGEALKNLWKNWKDDSKKAHMTLKADRKAAWAEFKQTMKTECRETRLPKEDGEPKDAAGAVTL